MSLFFTFNAFMKKGLILLMLSLFFVQECEGYEDLPQHQIGTKNIKPLLRDLLSNFKIDYDVENLKNTASELDLLSLVSLYTSIVLCYNPVHPFVH